MRLRVFQLPMRDDEEQRQGDQKVPGEPADGLDEDWIFKGSAQ